MKRQRVVVESTTIPASHRELREQLERDVARFLNEGGHIVVVEPGVSALSQIDFSPYGDLRKVNKKIYSLLKEEEEEMLDEF